MSHANVGFWLSYYKRSTPGVQVRTDGTTVLGNDSQPQPDMALRIVTGGQSRLLSSGYVSGCPELVCEVANSGQADDLRAKRRDYQRYGAQEYLAVVVRTPRVVWFARLGRRLVEMPPDSDGIYSSRVFPGLWLDPAALLADDLDRLTAVLDQGLATPAHAAFAADLRARQT